MLPGTALVSHDSVDGQATRIVVKMLELSACWSVERCLRPYGIVPGLHLRYDFQDLVNLLFKVHMQQPIGFVQDQVLEHLQGKALGIGEVVHHATWCAHNDVWSLA